MTERPSSSTLAEPQVSLSDAVISDWDQAMDRFFTAVSREALKRNLTSPEVADALAHGYGHDVADEWREWNDND